MENFEVDNIDVGTRNLAHQRLPPMKWMTTAVKGS